MDQPCRRPLLAPQPGTLNWAGALNGHAPTACANHVLYQGQLLGLPKNPSGPNFTACEGKAHPATRTSPLHPAPQPAPRTPTSGRYTRTSTRPAHPHPAATPAPRARPAHPAATPAPRTPHLAATPAPRTRTPQPAAAPGQVHPTARSIASHRALRIQLNAGLQLLGTVSEPKRNNIRTRFPLPNHRQAPRPDFLSRATSSSEKDRASR
jgi:hypothetical protein